MPYKTSSRINDVRISLGITQQAVAEKLGLSWNGVHKKLVGKSQFSINEILTLADWWNCSIDWLVGRDEGGEE